VNEREMTAWADELVKVSGIANIGASLQRQA